MPTLQVSFTPPNPAPSTYRLRYRIKGSNSAYTTLSPAPSSSPAVIPGLAFNTDYEGDISGDCGGSTFSTTIQFSTCTCPTGYAVSSDKNRCEKIETVSPTITSTNYCLAPSNLPVYTQYFSRIYKPGFSNSSIALYTAPSSDVFAQLTTPDLWSNASGSQTGGPMNFDGVWIDSDCDGVKDALATGAQVTIAYAFENKTEARTVYVGIAADNQFTLKVNGVAVAQTTAVSATENFRIWHIFPVTLNLGFNDFNAVGTGDGSTNDCIAMVVYDNTASQIQNAGSKSDLNILFATHQLFGQQINVATCPINYSLDTSQGVGNYICRKVTTVNCTGVVNPSNLTQLTSPLAFTATAQSQTQINLSWIDVSGESSYQLYSSTINNFASASVVASIAAGVTSYQQAVSPSITTTYYYWLIAKGNNTTTIDSESAVANATITIANTFTAYWGVKVSSGPLTQSEIEASSHTNTFTNSTNVVADYTYNHAFAYLWMAEPIAQPAKTKISTPLGADDNIGPSGTFNNPTIVNGVYRFYISQGLTKADTQATTFKIS